MPYYIVMRELGISHNEEERRKVHIAPDGIGLLLLDLVKRKHLCQFSRG